MLSVLPLVALTNQFIAHSYCFCMCRQQQPSETEIQLFYCVQLVFNLSAAAAKFTGSGGAVVVFCPNGDSQAAKLEERCSKERFVMVKVTVGPAQQ